MSGIAEKLGGRHQMNRVKHAGVDLLMYAVTEVELKGQGNLDIFRELGEAGERRAIAGNHRSNFDAGAVDHGLQSNGYPDLARDIVWLLGVKLKLGRATQHLCDFIDHIDVIPPGFDSKLIGKREAYRIHKEAVEASQEVLGEGKIIGVFPEGSRTRTGELGPFVSGVGYYFDTPSPNGRPHEDQASEDHPAKAPDVYVLPFALWNTETVWPVDELPRLRAWPRRGKATLSFGEPFTAASIMNGSGKDRYTSFADGLRERVEALIPEEYRLLYAPAEEIALAEMR